MTRQKKIEMDKYIESLIYLFIIRQGAFDWWLEPWLFQNVARTAGVSLHKVKRVFYKIILPENESWLNNFTY